jgi:hypothetical protein
MKNTEDCLHDTCPGSLSGTFKLQTTHIVVLLSREFGLTWNERTTIFVPIERKRYILSRGKKHQCT